MGGVAETTLEGQMKVIRLAPAGSPLPRSCSSYGRRSSSKRERACFVLSPKLEGAVRKEQEHKVCHERYNPRHAPVGLFYSFIQYNMQGAFQGPCMELFRQSLVIGTHFSVFQVREQELSKAALD